MKRNYYKFSGADNITTKEALIISLIVQGYRGKQISDLLGKSYNTVIHQLQSIFDKSGIHDSDLIASAAMQSGFDKKGCYKKKNLFEDVVLHTLPKGADPSVTA